MNKIQGLSQQEARERLAKFGPNEIKEVSKSSPLLILFRQIKKNFIFYLLVVAATISFIVGKGITGYAICGVIILVITTGFIQEYKAEKAISALKKMILPLTSVIRNGKEEEIPSSEIVVDDILVLRSGERVPADCILIEGEDVEVNEAILTGESDDVAKQEAPSIDKYSKENMLYMGSFIVSGKCYAKVIHTGMNTKFGEIAGMISETEKELPLQKKVNDISKFMVAIAITTSLATGAIILSRATGFSTEYLTEILILVIALSVSSFPEGFPVVLTTTLAAGASRMAKQNAIVNRMSIIETLGETTIICTDKTGTLTLGEMTVRGIVIDTDAYSVSGVGHTAEGQIIQKGETVDVSKSESLKTLLRTSILCNDSKIEKESNDHEYKVIGNQTEGALLLLGAKAKIFGEDFKAERLSEMPFSSERKMMSVLVKEGENYTVCAKGAFEVMLEKCTQIVSDGKTVKLTDEKKQQLVDINSHLAEKALRTLTIAYKENDENKNYSEENLIFLGIVALEDPPRDEARKAIEECARAHIKVKMITGDNMETAEAIGRQVGIVGKIIEGKKLEGMSDKELKDVVRDTAIFARVNPEHKLRIVRALKEHGEIVTMTGDGVNDAPALKEAHIGVAMGKNGTDVSRSVADLTLKDDNFATIVSAIREGRTIFNNIRKFVTYQLCDNFAEITMLMVGVLLAPVLGWEVPLLVALQILFFNLVTDNMPAITLGLNPTSKDIMDSPPRKNSSILRRVHLGVIVGLGSLMAISALIVHYIVFNVMDSGVDVGRTAILITIILLEIVNAYSFRSFRKPVLTRSPLVNKYLFIATVLSILATLVVVYNPIANTIFSTSPLSIYIWILAIIPSILILIFQDLIKVSSNTRIQSFIRDLSD